MFILCLKYPWHTSDVATHRYAMHQNEFFHIILHFFFSSFSSSLSRHGIGCAYIMHNQICSTHTLEHIYIEISHCHRKLTHFFIKKHNCVFDDDDDSAVVWLLSSGKLKISFLLNSASINFNIHIYERRSKWYKTIKFCGSFCSCKISKNIKKTNNFLMTIHQKPGFQMMMMMMQNASKFIYIYFKYIPGGRLVWMTKWNEQKFHFQIKSFKFSRKRKKKQI